MFSDETGICIYVHNNIDSSVVTFIDSPTGFEKIWITFSYCKQAYYVACCYHPPAPRYCPEDLIAEIIDDIDQIMLRNDSSPIVLVAGDFNGLKTDFIEELCGPTLIVHDITHGKKISDIVFTDRPDLFNAYV